MAERYCPKCGKKLSAFDPTETESCWHCAVPFPEPQQETSVLASTVSPPLPKLKFIAAVFSPWATVAMIEPVNEQVAKYVPWLQGFASFQVLGFLAILIGSPIYAAYLVVRGRPAWVLVPGCVLAIFLIAVNLVCFVTVG